MSRVGDALFRLRSGAGGDAEALAPGWVLPAADGQPEVPWRFDQPVAPVAPAPVRESVDAPERLREAPTSLEPSASAGEINPDVAERVITSPHLPFHAVEHYRRLAATLHEAQRDRSLRVVMVTSAVVGEGKSLTATNLALTLSQSYRRQVLLVDADLRRPTLHDIFQLSSSGGLSEGLRAGGPQAFATVRFSPTLTVLPAGRPESDPMAGLTSPRMAQLVAEAREDFDWIVIDTPPVSLMPDAKLLSGMADCVLLVVAAGVADLDAVKQAVKSVGRKKVFGVVLNRADDEPANGYYYQD